MFRRVKWLRLSWRQAPTRAAVLLLLVLVLVLVLVV